MLKKGWYSFLFISLFLVLQLPAQNPFDIPGRISVDSIDEEFVPKLLETQNLKDIDLEEIDLDVENPFDVSHIPLIKRRSQSEPIKRTKIGKGFFEQNFVFFLLLLSMILITLVISLDRQYISQLYSSIFNEASQRIIHRVHSSLFSPLNIILYLIFFINAALLIYFLLYSKGIMTQGIQTYVKVLAGVATIYVVKHLFISIVENVFLLEKYLSKYDKIVFNNNHILGISLILSNLLILYSFEGISYIVAILSLCLVVGLYLLRILKSIFIAAPIIASNGFHFFIYLCGFEILPILVLWRMISSNGIPL